ncbi:beta-ketoacyl-ACP synthase III [Kribbia dieselivorans]|uniref:beta-ketoacyl-ACP synthase III n=1 Tax=Kribbia dieselivorans TaxID=331526 RepID=UPI0008398908|nr:beta-ketoacyl-ACP synthase III [Kribbia dieselivorans]
MAAQITMNTPMRYARMLGVGAYRPDRVIPNSEIVDAIDSSDEWIQSRSGVKQRYRARPDESVVDMSEVASRDALAMAGLDASQIDAVIVATVTHMYQTPGAAPLLAARLGLTCAAFDVSAACAGYAYAVSVANDMVRAGTADHVLVVGMEKLLDITDLTDRGSAFIFGDGGGAAIIGPSDVPGIGPTVWGSDGTKSELITQAPSWTDFGANRDLPWPTLRMEGPAVFRWAVYEMAKVCQQALDATGITADELDVFIPHQANIRIIDSMVKQLKLPESVYVARDIVETANTSAGSIPLATERLLRERPDLHGTLALQMGFGAGLVYAAQVVVLP